MRNKSDLGGRTYDLVSDADLDSEQAVASEIRNAFPDHELLGEEALVGDTSAEHLWIIDPLDGTNNYAHAVPHFAVSVAYYHRGQPAAGAIYNPSTDTMYTAIRGGGSKVQRGERDATVAGAVQTDSLGEVLVGCGFYYDRGDMMKRTLSAIEEFFSHDIHGIRRFGTASLDLVMVGLGVFGGFFEYQLAPWDFAAGRLFVTEAGGVVTDARGEELPIAKTSLLAAGAPLHPVMLEITKRHHP